LSDIARVDEQAGYLAGDNKDSNLNTQYLYAVALLTNVTVNNVTSFRDVNRPWLQAKHKLAFSSADKNWGS